MDDDNDNEVEGLTRLLPKVQYHHFNKLWTKKVRIFYYNFQEYLALVMEIKYVSFNFWQLHCLS